MSVVETFIDRILRPVQRPPGNLRLPKAYWIMMGDTAGDDTGGIITMTFRPFAQETRSADYLSIENVYARQLAVDPVSNYRVMIRVQGIEDQILNSAFQPTVGATMAVTSTVGNDAVMEQRDLPMGVFGHAWQKRQDVAFEILVRLELNTDGATHRVGLWGYQFDREAYDQGGAIFPNRGGSL